MLPICRFGAPAIFCEGGAGGGAACVCDADADAALQTAAGPQSCRPSGVLGLLGLPDGAVRNVLMHRDIVPRAVSDCCVLPARL